MSNKLDDGTQERLNAFCLNWNGHSVLGRRFASPFFITIEARWFGGEARQTLLTAWLQVKTLLHMMFCAVVFACTSSQLARLLKQSTAILASRYVVSLIHFLEMGTFPPSWSVTIISNKLLHVWLIYWTCINTVHCHKKCFCILF